MGLAQSQSVVLYIFLHSALPWLCLELCEIERNTDCEHDTVLQELTTV
jgi:hypothetical protein